VPGVGQTFAPVILLETGPIDRFADVGNFARPCALRRQHARR
jgi:hypothetical protein